MHLPYAKIASAREVPNIDPSPQPQKPKPKPSRPNPTGQSIVDIYSGLFGASINGTIGQALNFDA